MVVLSSFSNALCTTSLRRELELDREKRETASMLSANIFYEALILVQALLLLCLLLLLLLWINLLSIPPLLFPTMCWLIRLISTLILFLRLSRCNEETVSWIPPMRSTAVRFRQLAILLLLHNNKVDWVGRRFCDFHIYMMYVIAAPRHKVDPKLESL